MPFVVREMGLEPTRLWLDTGTSSLPVYLFQHSRIGAFWTLDYYSPIICKSQEFFSNVLNTNLKTPLFFVIRFSFCVYYMARQPSRASKKRARVPGPTWEPVTGS